MFSQDCFLGIFSLAWIKSFFDPPRPSLAREGSTSPPSPLSSGEGDVTALLGAQNRAYGSLRYPPAELSPFGLAAFPRNRVAIALRLIGGLLCGCKPALR